MTHDRVKKFLAANGYPQHLVRGGEAGLVRRWREFVEQVETGYKVGLEDYRNDLDIRAILQAAGAETAEVLELDARLKKMLTAKKTRVWKGGKGDEFWNFGYPKNASGDLLEGLQEEGIA
jgi:hypothetical protein